ncbi:uncharacterized protein MONOS_10609 [Monocercomonoides exilis]|uniref:uncharacterized protein n=1 Tax=Monocercomonoides exilis TaxID=2049356 RepID=UPI003559BC58|nr:hypothetical protein MONOS_10609 [Monocercomonoides exilis]|eukprot:MONOS_10609.1-p1 / transcript=MONOS_10609.1 / gene=MONOS_10609 / organism=Monocercomonoides_exilis_PA203 / gene_product=unspecified product / transcript_product=unspecified product / location=Mono_scaffold00489:13508-14763(+) / protein_length=349 / sequence_SO=supercontig / SO=protein_coding / is_pseudo=false
MASVGVSKPEITRGSLGRRLLLKLGWKEGSGLGKKEDGPTACLVGIKQERFITKDSTADWFEKLYEDIAKRIDPSPPPMKPSIEEENEEHNSNDFTESLKDRVQGHKRKLKDVEMENSESSHKEKKKHKKHHKKHKDEKKKKDKKEHPPCEKDEGNEENKICKQKEQDNNKKKHKEVKHKEKMEKQLRKEAKSERKKLKKLEKLRSANVSSAIPEPVASSMIASSVSPSVLMSDHLQSSSPLPYSRFSSSTSILYPSLLSNTTSSTCSETASASPSPASSPSPQPSLSPSPSPSPSPFELLTNSGDDALIQMGGLRGRSHNPTAKLQRLKEQEEEYKRKKLERESKKSN